jgi:hypothetical protein
MLGFAATYILAAICGSIISKEKLGNFLVNNLPSGIYHLNIPDFLFLIFFVFVFILLNIFNKRFRWLSVDKFKEMIAENNQIKKHNESLIETYNTSIKEMAEIRRYYLEMRDKISPFLDKFQNVTFIFHDYAYWLTEVDKSPEGPFCPKCFEDNKKIMHMIPLSSENWFQCPTCKLRIKTSID